MSIEKDLSRSIRSGSDHKAKLRRALVTHMDKDPVRRRSRKLWPLLLAAPIAALAVFAGLAIIPTGQKDSPGFVQNTLKPLTAQQVLAQAVQAVPEDTLQPGQYYYMKVFRQSVGYNKENGCDRRTDISEFYLNQARVAVKTVRYTQDGRLFQIDTTTEDGMQRGEEFFWDEELNRTTQTPAECTPTRTYSHGDNDVLTEADLERMRNDPVNKAISALVLEMPTPDQQRDALKTLGNAKGWKVTQNVSAEGYAKPVTQLEYADPDNREVTQFYFDPQTKRYIGQRTDTNINIVLEQDVRPLKKNPEYKITTPIGQM